MTFHLEQELLKRDDIVILNNSYSNFAVLKILDIKDCIRSNLVDELTFEYVINPDKQVYFKLTKTVS